MVCCCGDAAVAYGRGILFGPVMPGVTSCFQYSHARSPPGPPPVPLGTTAARGAFPPGALGATRRGFGSNVPSIGVRCCPTCARTRRELAPLTTPYAEELTTTAP